MLNHKIQYTQFTNILLIFCSKLLSFGVKAHHYCICVFESYSTKNTDEIKQNKQKQTLLKMPHYGMGHFRLLFADLIIIYNLYCCEPCLVRSFRFFVSYTDICSHRDIGKAEIISVRKGGTFYLSLVLFCAVHISYDIPLFTPALHDQPPFGGAYRSLPKG